MEPRAIEYLEQTLYVFSKMAKLFFEKGKPHNASLIVKIKVLILTFEYESKPVIDISMKIFQIRILIKRSRFFTSAHMDQ